MEYFLEKIAKSLHAEFGNSLHRHCLVFPSRRAGLYFLKYLATYIEKPVWIPAVITINDLFRSFSSLKVAESEILLAELYKVYRIIARSPESFDDFYFWGDMLINDFDDIDKYLADASLLFRNVSDLRTIDQQFGTLTPEQIEIIKQFWTNFDAEKLTGEKSGFLKIWSILTELYSSYRKSLLEKGVAYEGMIFRQVVEQELNNETLDIKWDTVHFIGFNALNNCEIKLMTRLKNHGKARFYWDYDSSFMSGSKMNTAGYFLERNLKLFGDDMPPDWNRNSFLTADSLKVRRRVIATSSDVAQVKLIPELVREIEGLSPENAHHTAVVLADENLLVPVLSSLPRNIGDVNITMGYPMKQTHVYSFVKLLLALQKNSRVESGVIYFRHSDVLSILRHQMTRGLWETSGPDELTEKIIKANLIWIPSAYFSGSESLLMIFTRVDTPAKLSEYLKRILAFLQADEINGKSDSAIPEVRRNVRNEFIYRVVLSINRLESVLSGPDLTLTTGTYIRILDRILRNQSVPFSGEPLSGIQIMGILETRTLDFKNIIMLSVNDGILPASSAGSSFIPVNIRVAFGLPDISHQESVYAYHFYRIMQRAGNITFVYNSNSEGLKSGEVSRFILQMNYEETLKPEFLNLVFEIRTHNSLPDTIERNEQHSQLLKNTFCSTSLARLLSPTAINMWLNCRMKFYYRYVNNLKEPEKITTEVDPAMMGSLLHDMMKNLYGQFKGAEVIRNSSDMLISNEKYLDSEISGLINDRFGNNGLAGADGNLLVAAGIIKEYILRILKNDREITPFTIQALEELYSFTLSPDDTGCQYPVITGGYVDRIDSVDGTVRIVDYKTGKVATKISSPEELFRDDRSKDTDAWLQTLLYCEAYLRRYPELTVRPSVYRIREREGDDRLMIKPGRDSGTIVDDYRTIRHEFTFLLNKVIGIILGDSEPFVMTTDKMKCNWCPYRVLCMR